MNKELYDSIPEGYYYYAFKEGNAVQRFWHKYKFMEIINMLCLENKRLLDIGCGAGVLLSLLPQTYESAIGLDIAQKQIDFAEKKFHYLKKIEWVACDFNSTIFSEESFDYIISSEFIEHISYEDFIKLLKKIKFLLKKDGRLIITTPNYRSLWPLIEYFWNKISKVSYEEQHINKLNIPKLKKAFNEEGFEIIETKTFFIVSPFLSILSYKLAKMVLKIEKKIFPYFGSIIIIEVKNERKN